MPDNEFSSRGVFPARFIERLQAAGAIVAPPFDADQVQP
ncbi:MAG TPA: 2'-deoxycytidine 5'-triphosphate deaminase, partial [Alphaproteobacteria bacterium]|nr:2'-deoxycytidine 5'-triphosphate deaminase [Alphaproteobacteria bacterium]